MENDKRSILFEVFRSRSRLQLKNDFGVVCNVKMTKSILDFEKKREFQTSVYFEAIRLRPKSK